MKRKESKRIGESLLKEGIISRIQLKEALEKREREGIPLAQIFIKMGYLSEEELATHSVDKYGYPYLPLSHYEVNPEVIKAIPEEVARKYLILPVDKIGSLLTLAQANPLDAEVIEIIKNITGCSITSYVSTVSDIEKAIELYYKKKT